MNTLSTFIFFDETSTETMSNPMINSNKGEELIIQVIGDDVDLIMYGVADVKSDERVPMGCINLSTYDVASEITEAGIYSIATSGISRFYCENNGTVGGVKVYGKLLA